MHISSTDRDVRKFGLLFAAISAGVAVLSYVRGGAAWPWWTAAGALFLITGLFFKPVLRPIHVAWMKFAFVLGWINTRILLGVFFYLILTPVGIILRLTGQDILKLRVDRSAPTYWIRREAGTIDPSRYQRIF